MRGSTPTRSYPSREGASEILLRLDKYLVAERMASSREEARELIKAGRVSVNGIVRDKASSMVQEGASVSVERADGPRWASRGAHKLLKGLDEFAVSPAGKSCTDIGASTGGFTHVLLERGAARVAAVDVGYGQLAWELRSDPRVKVLDRTNARSVTAEEIGWLADIITVDASFISLRLLLPNLERLMAAHGLMIALVKPQFEVGRARVGKGVVRDPALHLETLISVRDAASECGLAAVRATWSPIKGPEGNIEFIFMAERAAESDLAPVESGYLEELVAHAHDELG